MKKRVEEYLVYRRELDGYRLVVGKVHKSHHGDYFLLWLKGDNRPLYIVPASKHATKFRIFRKKKSLSSSDFFERLAGRAVLPFRGATFLKTNLHGAKDAIHISLIPKRRKHV